MLVAQVKKPAPAWPAKFTAPTWGEAFRALWNADLARRGMYRAPYPDAPGKPTPTVAPRLTNGEAVTVLLAWMGAIGSSSRVRQMFPLWYQFAAVAYGWSPDNDTLDASDAQRDAWYPDVLLVELWKQTMLLANDLDDAKVKPVELSMDGAFDDIAFRAEVRIALRDDGAEAAFKIPVPGCKGKDGKMHAPRCKRVMDRWPYLCEEWEPCAPAVIDDPGTVVKKKALSAFQLVLLIGACWLVFDNRSGRQRARRRAR